MVPYILTLNDACLIKLYAAMMLRGSLSSVLNTLKIHNMIIANSRTALAVKFYY